MSTVTVNKKTAASTKPTATDGKKAAAAKQTHNLFTGIGRLGRDPEMRVRRVA
jgi:hypothetical protein